MSHSPSRRTIDRENERRRAEVAKANAAGAEATRVYARRIVALWSARVTQGKRASNYPTIDTAITAGMPFLAFLCPACQQVGETDLRDWSRHPDATIASLIPALSCQRCSPNPPFARLVGLAETRTIPRHARSRG